MTGINNLWISNDGSCVDVIGSIVNVAIDNGNTHVLTGVLEDTVMLYI